MTGRNPILQAPGGGDEICRLADVNSNRMKRDEFFDKLAAVDETTLKKALWTAYWRGSATTRELIEGALDPSGPPARQSNPRPDVAVVAAEVAEFAALAREGAYLGRDRRVSPKERTRWRLTFRRLAHEAADALAGTDVDRAVSAMETLIELACESKSYDYFRSQDPMEAARFVVSGATEALWSAIRRRHGFDEFSLRAARQMLRWEADSGWTRVGYGWVAERETTLAHVLAGMLPTVDAWGQIADDYLTALDRAPAKLPAATWGDDWKARTGELAEWHRLLVERLADSDYDDRLDVLVNHPRLAGPERVFLQARLAQWRGDHEQARRLIKQCLRALPGHPGFLAFAAETGA